MYGTNIKAEPLEVYLREVPEGIKLIQIVSLESPRDTATVLSDAYSVAALLPPVKLPKTAPIFVVVYALVDKVTEFAKSNSGIVEPPT